MMQHIDRGDSDGNCKEVAAIKSDSNMEDILVC